MRIEGFKALRVVVGGFRLRVRAEYEGYKLWIWLERSLKVPCPSG